ncbi:PpiC-type peptidyl-prolyl cis-trans isomerase [Candidatus Moduliflexus flocculans]|uniref:PpiC-type peptidyl-prolyl cis-trans isomerase n=1 Tax=Candidatus Moduliflexus flocculans TaxID=1499966 RepID=A0A0S6VTF7_9BACT|nr:PpiC-type peptidyl-prolyl cis-trans isomerase [Candidatus Moduliflexus flocculans]
MKNVVIGLLVFCGFQIGLTGVGAENVDGIAAVVNKKVITRSRIHAMEQEFLKQGRFDSTEDENARKEKILTFLIENELIVQKAEEYGVAVTSEELKAALDDVKKRNNLFTDDELKAAINQQGTTWSEYLDDVRKQIKIAKLMNSEVRSKVLISEDEVSKYFEEHRGDFQAAPAKVHIRQIFLSVKPGASDDDVSAILDNAARIVKELRGGADFAEMAKAHSEHPSAANGGELGTFQEGQLAAPFDAAFNMAAGEISDPIRFDDGFHIIYVETKTGGEENALQNARTDIRRKLFEQKADALYKEWMAELKKTAYIEIR